MACLAIIVILVLPYAMARVAIARQSKAVLICVSLALANDSAGAMSRLSHLPTMKIGCTAAQSVHVFSNGLPAMRCVVCDILRPHSVPS